MGFLDNIAEKEYERQRMGESSGDAFNKKKSAAMMTPFAKTPVGFVIHGMRSENQGEDDFKSTARNYGLQVLNYFTMGALTRRAKDMKALEEADIAAGERVKSLEEFQRELQRTLQQGAEIQQERMTFI